MQRYLLFICAATGFFSIGQADEPLKEPVSIIKNPLNSDEFAYINSLSKLSDLIDIAIGDYEQNPDLTILASKIDSVVLTYANQQGIELYKSGVRVNIAEAAAKNVPSRFLSTHAYYSKGLRTLINSLHVVNSSRQSMPSTEIKRQLEVGLNLLDRAWSEVAEVSTVRRSPRKGMAYAKEIESVSPPLSSVPRSNELTVSSKQPKPIEKTEESKLRATFNQKINQGIKAIDRSNSRTELASLWSTFTLLEYSTALKPIQKAKAATLAEWAMTKSRFLNNELAPNTYPMLRNAYLQRIQIIQQQ